MYRLLFRSWKIAALWAIGTMVSLGAVFSGGEQSTMNKALEQITEQPAGVVSEASFVRDEVPGEGEFGSPMDSAGSESGDDEVTYATLSDGRRVALRKAKPGSGALVSEASEPEF